MPEFLSELHLHLRCLRPALLQLRVTSLIPRAEGALAVGRLHLELSHDRFLGSFPQRRGKCRVRHGPTDIFRQGWHSSSVTRHTPGRIKTELVVAENCIEQFLDKYD